MYNIHHISGPLSDAFGRKRAFCFAFLLMIIAIFCSVLSTNWKCFALFRFFVGGLFIANVAILRIWSMELTDQRHNVIMNIAGTESLAYIITAGIAYFSYEWTTYLLVLNLIAIPVMFVLLFCVESPRWQVQKRAVC